MRRGHRRGTPGAQHAGAARAPALRAARPGGPSTRLSPGLTCPPVTNRPAAETKGRGGDVMTEQSKQQSESLPRTEEEWRQRLTPEQFKVLRNKGTERAFTGAYASAKERGVYRC